MLTQQDIYAAGSENRPPMLNKDNYIPWSSRLLCYEKSNPNRKLVVNSILHGLYVRRMIVELGSDIGEQEKKAKLFNEWELFRSKGESIVSYYHRFSKLINDFAINNHILEKIASNLKFLNNLQPEWKRYVTIVHQTKDLHTIDYTQLYDFLKFNQAKNAGNQIGYNAWQLIGNQNGYNAMQNARNQVGQNAVQNPSIQIVRNQNGLIVILRIANQNANQNRNGNVVAARAEGNGNGNNSNKIRCYNCRGLGHYARNYTVRPRRRDAAYLRTQLLIAQKEEAGIELQTKEFDLMAAGGDIDKIKEVNANYILMANLQQASTSGTQTDKDPVYDSNGSAEVHHYENCYDNEIFNMLLKRSSILSYSSPLPSHIRFNKIPVMFIAEPSMEHNGGIVEQHHATVEETRAYFESLYNNLVTKVEKVNTVSHKMKEANVDLTTKLASYKGQEKCFEFSQEKFDKLEIHQEVHKILKYEIAPIVNQVDARVINFEKQFLKEAAKFVGDFKSLAKEDDESLDMNKVLEYENERLLRAVVSQDILLIVQNNYCCRYIKSPN
ncbi:hypothetical protein Tco_1349330 [Tanacetum coccineum]